MEHDPPLKPSKFGMWSRRLGLPLILLAFFSPILSTGLFNDDMVYAVITYRQPDSFEFISGSIFWFIRGMMETGRFTAVSTTLLVTMFHFFDFNNPIGYHVLQILLIGLSSYWFAYWFVPGGANKIAAVLLVCMMSANYRGYHDPYLSYHLLMPVFTLLFLGSVALFERHLETGAARYGLAALGLYLLALATYEIAYPLILVFFVQLLRVRPKCLRTWLFLAVLSLVMASFQLWLRMQAKEITYEGISIGLNPWSVMRALVFQVFSSVPFAQQIAGIFRKITVSYGGSLLEVPLVLGILAGLVALSVYLLLRFFRNRSRENALLLIGLIVWLVPALVIAISSKYQAELRWGLGYLPRYLQNFGLVLVILGLAGRFLISRVGLVALVSLVLLVFALNVRTIHGLNRDFAAARLLYNVIEDQEFLTGMGCGRLFVTNSYMYSGKQFEALNPAVEVRDSYKDKESPKHGDHVLLIHPGNPESEWAILGVYQDKMVREPFLLLGKRQAGWKGGAETSSFKEWSISPLGVVEMNYEDLLESVTSGVLPAQ